MEEEAWPNLECQTLRGTLTPMKATKARCLLIEKFYSCKGYKPPSLRPFRIVTPVRESLIK
jgi:hypothetical protein